jgi:hypothetical protein
LSAASIREKAKLPDGRWAFREIVALGKARFLEKTSIWSANFRSVGLNKVH